MSVVVVQWCSLCNSRESAGILTVLEPSTREYVDLQACYPCVETLGLPQQLELELGL